MTHSDDALRRATVDYLNSDELREEIKAALSKAWDEAILAGHTTATLVVHPVSPPEAAQAIRALSPDDILKKVKEHE